MPDAIFEEPRLAEIYDALDPVRTDLDAYVDLAHECARPLRARRRMWDRHPRLPSRSARHGGDRSRSCRRLDRDGPPQTLGRSGALVGRRCHLAAPAAQVDLVTMTGNVAQVFLTDDEWQSALDGLWATLRPGGRFVFEVRDPAREDWRNWTREQSFRRHELPEIGAVESWVELVVVTPPFCLVPFELRLCGRRRRAHLGLDAALQGAGRDRCVPRCHGLRRRRRTGCT